MRVKTKVERKGLFWLPEKEDRQVHGTLFIECDGAVRLEIIGHFDENIERPSINDSAFRIVGHVEIEGAVTLEDCFYTKKNFSFGGISRSEILVNTALFGAIWPEQEDITFNTFSFSVDCLDEWIGITGIEVKEDFQNWTAVIKVC